MSYTVLARRYRSQDFDEVIGQEPIAKTLRRAIDSDRTAHAYLFCGTRGVGKTSMARIFAKALNVVDNLKDADQIAAEIMAGNDIDVIEIDGASNRGVENARDLIANSIYRPARCPYKIYIIDEVHMLTREAFNALLKTMEEPPAHVKFILCTTEPQKVPATIQSRCQRFDFRIIPTTRIAKHLQSILDSEKIKAEKQVVLQVAQLGHGSMRDALSLLDRLLSTGEKKITAKLLEEMLGLPDQTLVTQLVDAVAESNPAIAIQTASELLSRGIALDQLLEILIQHFRTLMVVSVCAKQKESLSQLANISEDQIESYQEQSKRFDPPALVHMIVLLENVGQATKYSSTARALFDAALVRLTMSEKFADVQALLAGVGSETDKKKLNTKKVTPPTRPTPHTESKKQQTPTPSQPTSRPTHQSANHLATSIGKRDEVARIPVVRKAMDILDARIIDVRDE